MSCILDWSPNWWYRGFVNCHPSPSLIAPCLPFHFHPRAHSSQEWGNLSHSLRNTVMIASCHRTSPFQWLVKLVYSGVHWPQVAPNSTDLSSCLHKWHTVFLYIWVGLHRQTYVWYWLRPLIWHGSGSVSAWHLSEISCCDACVRCDAYVLLQSVWTCFLNASG